MKTSIVLIIVMFAMTGCATVYNDAASDGCSVATCEEHTPERL